MATREHKSLSSKSTKTKCVLGLALASALFGASAQAVDGPSAEWQTIAGGGGISTADRFMLSGTIGQPVAGVSTGTNCALAAGFWGEVTLVPNPVAAGFRFIRSGANIILSWPASLTGFVPQSTTELTSQTVWRQVTQPAVLVGNEYQVTVPMNKPKEFFRLAKQQ